MFKRRNRYETLGLRSNLCDNNNEWNCFNKHRNIEEQTPLIVGTVYRYVYACIHLLRIVCLAEMNGLGPYDQLGYTVYLNIASMHTCCSHVCVERF